jgi:tetratricopeptide (TPR) repeat protein
MRKLTWAYLLLALALMAICGAFVYRLPPVHSRLSWRVDFALTYLRGLVDPIQPMPTAQPDATRLAALPSPSPTPLPTATPMPPATAAATETPLPTFTPPPPAVALQAPEWEKQDINNCGPAALAMYLRYYGWEGTQEDVARVLKPQREDRNVNVEELAYYTRNNAGWLNFEYRVGGDLELLKRLLAAGIPVMIEESFHFEEPYWTNDDLWAAHYQLLTGYDDQTQTFTGQDSFYGPDRQIPYQSLDEYWQAFNRVYIVIYLPGQEQAVKDILGSNLEADANRQRALEVAQAETQSDPENAFAWFNLGTNLTYFERYVEATSAYDQARELGLPQRMLRYQFGPFIAYFHTGQIDDLMALTEYALKVTPNAEEALLWRGWALYRQGKTAEALDSFEKALAENPTYQDAQYALDFVRANQ